MSSVSILHNPRCSKSRQTLALLEQQGIPANVVLYLETPPTIDELANFQKLLGFKSAREFMRTKEDIYKQLDLKNQHDEGKLLAAMSENPKLIERPIVIANGRAKIGRPPEQVLEIL